jgi:tetratricopeptide (TPR) repeat protein
MGERADYLRTSAILCMEHPLAGAGWGNFFRTHMRIKKSDVVESARDPHNVVAAFAGQCGIPAGLAILAVLIAPLAMLWKERFRKNLQSAVFWCGTVFTLHSLIDCDWQVPALIALMGSLYACAISQLPAEPLPKGKIWLITAAVIVITGGVFTSYRYIAGDAALSKLQDKVNPPSKDTALLLASFSVEKLAADAAGYRPDSAVIPLTLGDWYFRRGNLTAAEKHYLHALKLDPCRPALHARLAQIKLRQNNLPEAQKYMLEAHRLFPKNPEYKLPEPASLHQQ